jgi:hypothetical protein
VDDDFRLDLRFGKASDVTRGVRGVEIHDRRVVHIGPDRLAHAVQGPHVGIGEADFSTDGDGALVEPRLMDHMRHVVGYGLIETAQL